VWLEFGNRHHKRAEFRRRSGSDLCKTVATPWRIPRSIARASLIHSVHLWASLWQFITELPTRRFKLTTMSIEAYRPLRWTLVPTT
jgi:hypothetical protein